jgi:hypothetical protein
MFVWTDVLVVVAVFAGFFFVAALFAVGWPQTKYYNVVHRIRRWRKHSQHCEAIVNALKSGVSTIYCHHFYTIPIGPEGVTTVVSWGDGEENVTIDPWTGNTDELSDLIAQHCSEQVYLNVNDRGANRSRYVDPA